MYLINNHVKILKYISHHPYAEYSKIKKHFKKMNNFEELFTELRYNEYISPIDGNFNPYGELLATDASPYLITKLGIATCESHSVFTLPFVIKDIILPIIIAIITTFITVFLTT